MDNPFFILFVGVAVVIGMIIGLRINAFIALISAALVVSFLAPGEIAEKVSRVASAFGGTAGGVGIVIALAAVIGKCLMDSGAADRIVQAFVGGMGQKRASWALTGSGFVLAIPVFFDTVFYLLVPLARSLYRSTKKNYLKYILAISAGGAITHTMVPPTPGPLLMAQQLGVDLGVMIGVGSLIGLAAAIAGLVFSSWLDKRMPIEMRPLPGDEEIAVESGADRKLPNLFLSLLPIILPVLLIGANTVLETRANGERAAQVKVADFTDFGGLKQAVESAEKGTLKKLQDSVDFSSPEVAAASFNMALADRTAFDTGVSLGRSNLAFVEHENRKVIEAALPEGVLATQVWETPAREAANLSKLYGNANLALLISAVIAVLLYVSNCRPTRKEFSDSLEMSLMSGGLIILITAAGGAFGAMLAAAQIGPAIAGMFGSSGGAIGVSLLLLAFGISSLLKFAQGSTTVAVITASGMIAAMIDGVELGFHPVYLATAIGGGGLFGSWMNDSGFWIFSKMSGLTEAEALKSWTPMLAILGLTSFIMSVILSLVMPLV
ncbi:MAG: SLC13 family permease [Verrucomicrobiales bacterium]|nr:SLC13 family permease [Verrucomicrobiales bacterium]